MAAMKKVVIAAQERIDDLEHTAIEFFRAVLGMERPVRARSTQNDWYKLP